MGRELYFYPCIKYKDTGKIEPLLFNKKGEPEHIFWRSQSFVDMDYFIEELPMIDLNSIEEKYVKYFNGYSSLFDTENPPSYVYMLDDQTLYERGNSYGIISGYQTLEEIEKYYAIDPEYRQEYIHWEMPTPISAEVVADMPFTKRENYYKFFCVDIYSKEYVCSVLKEILDDLWSYNDGMEYEYCYIVVYSF